jgi:hypothetical protein
LAGPLPRIHFEMVNNGTREFAYDLELDAASPRRFRLTDAH